MTTDQGPRYTPLAVTDGGLLIAAPWSGTSAEWTSGGLDRIAARWRIWTRALWARETAGEARTRALAMLATLRATCDRLAARLIGLALVEQITSAPRVAWPPGRVAALSFPSNGPPAIRAGPPFAMRR